MPSCRRKSKHAYLSLVVPRGMVSGEDAITKDVVEAATEADTQRVPVSDRIRGDGTSGHLLDSLGPPDGALAVVIDVGQDVSQALGVVCHHIGRLQQHLPYWRNRC